MLNARVPDTLLRAILTRIMMVIISNLLFSHFISGIIMTITLFDRFFVTRTGGWLHVDMAGPGSKADRGTGYGVGLVLSLVGAPGFDVRS